MPETFDAVPVKQWSTVRRWAARQRAATAVATGAALLVAVSTGVAVGAGEPTPADRALATELFVRGKELITAGRVAEACRKLEESQRLDPGGGTLLNLAICHELEGKTATAWSEFVEARGIARRDARPERIELAEQHIAALGPRLVRLVIVVPPAADHPGLSLLRDGTLVARAAWGMAMPVDPGEHRLEASAPGRKTWRTAFDLRGDGERREIAIPPLEEAGVAPPPVARAPRAARAADQSASAAPRASNSGGGVTSGYVFGALGVAAASVGSYFGIVAISRRRDSDELCVPRCTAAAVEVNGEARTAADVSTVSFVVGAVALGIGVYLLVADGATAPAPTATAPRRRAPRASLLPIVRF